jgi:hypothetical protein
MAKQFVLVILWLSILTAVIAGMFLSVAWLLYALLKWIF